MILEKLSSKPILILFDPEKDIIVKTDVSAYAWGAVLVQLENGIEHPVSFASGTLNSSQRNWPTWKREAYGVLRAINKWSHYLLGATFTVVTDHQANVYLLDPLKKHPPIINNWKIQLSQYSYKVVHRPGRTLVIEDSLSRSPNLLLTELDNDKLISLEKIIEEQKNDEVCLEIKKLLQDGLEMKHEIKKLLIFDVENHFVIENDCLYYIESNSKFASRRVLRILLPKILIRDIFELHHCLPIKGHMGFNRTWGDIVRQYYYPNLYMEILNLFKKCQICEYNKVTKIQNTEYQFVVANEPFEIIEIDHIVIKVKSLNDYNYILVVTDKFSKKSWFLPCKTLSATETFKLLFIHVFSQFFFPKYIYSDLSSAFNNQLDELICRTTGMQHKYTLPYSKGHTGAVENRNKVVEMIITKFVEKFDQNNWDEYCWTAAYSYNNSVSDNKSYSPDYLIFAREPYSVVDLGEIASGNNNKKLEEHIQVVKSDLERAWKISKEQTKKVFKKVNEQLSKKLKKPINFNSGQLVLLKSRGEKLENYKDKSINSKFSYRNIGPYEIKSIDEEKHAIVQITPSKTEIFHFNDLLIYEGNDKPFPDGYFTPSLNEIIKIKIPNPREPKQKERLISDKNKSKFDVKSIVGRRINIMWKQNKMH